MKKEKTSKKADERKLFRRRDPESDIGAKDDRKSGKRSKPLSLDEMIMFDEIFDD